MVINVRFKSVDLKVNIYEDEKNDVFYDTISQTDKEYIENSFKLAGMGYSFLLPSLAMGLTQRDLESVKSLENDVLKLGEKLIPLSSAYNQAQVDANPVGAPPKEEEIKSDKTKANEESINKTGQGGSE